MNFVADNANDLYVLALEGVINHGDLVSPRGMLTGELRGASLTLNDPTENLVTTRRLNIRFMVAEFLWILTGQNRADLISKFNSEIVRYSDDGIHMKGAYGPPVSDQLPWVIKQLKKDADTRQALLTIWRPMPDGSKDIPCTISMHFMLRNEGLEMITYMRSNDLWLGFPYDLFVFTMIQRYVASALDVPPSVYHHHVGSLHIYDRNIDQVTAAIDTPAPYINTVDLEPTYPWPLEVLECLIAAPNEVQRLYTLTTPMPEGWRNIISLLIPSYSSASPKWGIILDTHGVEPKGFRALV